MRGGRCCGVNLVSTDKKGERNMKFTNISIRILLLVSMYSLLIVPSVLIGIGSYTSARGEVKSLLQVSSLETNQLVTDWVKGLIQPLKADTAFLAGELTADTVQPSAVPALQARLDAYQAQHPELLNVYVGTSDKRKIQSVKDPIPAGYDPTTRPWYQRAAAVPSEVVIYGPFLSTTTGKQVISISKTFRDGSGVFAVDMSLDQLVEVMTGLNKDKDRKLMLLTSDNKILYHPDFKSGEPAGDWVKDMVGGEGDIIVDVDGVSTEIVYATSSLTGWKVGTMMAVSTYGQKANPILITMVSVLAVMLLIGTLLVRSTRRAIVGPLDELVEAAGRIKEGDLTKRVQLISRNEIGRLAQAFNEMTESMHSVIREVQGTTVLVASSSEQLSGGAGRTSAQAGSIAEAIDRVAAGADNQNQAMAESARALEEMAAGIQRVAESASGVADSSHGTSLKAAEGDESMQRMVGQMAEIDEAVEKSDDSFSRLRRTSEEIEEILGAIQGISQQTNLLALNAAIEAARAGEHGSGFAVVASEVRKLAEQSSRSVAEVSRLIQEIKTETGETAASLEQVKGRVKDGLATTGQAAQNFHAIMESMKEVSGQIQEISAVAEEMSAASEQVTASVLSMAGISQGTAKTAEQVNGLAQEQLQSMREISSSAENLAQTADKLQEIVKRFEV
ncbi:methyl-accepting chemotaxis sensory transducer [Paenibacillus mucilaginosus 3016]|uniref:Methyl-accepting chemotaxis sensory transducer n=1 Tax=Paenibacillus mucilaginosus 3016 TaxID=1116391 RepID=H6NLW8_9BACL|nr:methyl-accepting chemotaxis sensory transducer [Paenibacillus mucilaginosus 3016]